MSIKVGKKIENQFKVHSITKKKGGKTKKELSDCDKNWGMPRRNIEKQMIKILELQNDIFPNLAITKGNTKETKGLQRKSIRR